MLNPKLRVKIFVCIVGVVVLCGSCMGQQLRNNIFGKQNKNQVQVFVAQDVSEEVEQAVKDTLRVAVETWGSSGRLEYWVLGTNREAAVKLSEDFCRRRVERGQMTRADCQADHANKEHGFLMYQEIGATSLKTGKPRGSAGHNGGAEWGFHRMTSSLPLGFAGKLNIAGEDEQITILHEYWHSLQHSFIQSKDHDERRRLLGPAWFVEGSAVAMAEITADKLWKAKQMKRWNNSTNPRLPLEQRMRDKMRTIQTKRTECKTVLPHTYDGDCRQLAYDSGAWAVAYLMNLRGDDVLLKSFHPNVERLGWEKAFKQAFGMSSEEFEANFAAFLNLPIDDQVKVLPR